MSDNGLDKDEGQIIEFKTEVKTSEPDIHQKIIILKKGIEKSFIKLGAYLKEIRDRKLYIEVSFDTFEAYIAQPELAMERRTVFSIIGVYEDFVENEKCGQLHLDEITEIGYTKLERIRQFKNEADFGEWISKAKQLSLSDLNAEIREAKGEPEKVYNPKSKMITITCPYCNKSFEYTIKD